ncbi:glycosyl transferase family 2 [Dorcoceras hygrometricum]|uniref:Glycosyl transferase family 2 n=1 Tax=Dorcoceras hygrometricum TaxID=472368 RepID=A0A2Z7AT94_9LAMI|nr:glycosyl transferase family 2 [Dorcoceras hygrometricum]
MAPSAPRTRAAAALRIKQFALDNQDRTIRRLRAQLATQRRGLAATKKELEETRVALEASHKVIAGLTEIGLRMSKKVERMKVKKQQVRANHVECHQKFQAQDNHRIPHTTRNPSVRTAANSRQSSAAVPPNPLAKVLRKLRRVQKLCYQISHRNPTSGCAKFSRSRTPIPDFVLPVFSPAEFKRLVSLIQTPLALIFAFAIWVYEIFRLSGLLCVTNGLDPLEEQNLGTNQ